MNITVTLLGERGEELRAALGTNELPVLTAHKEKVHLEGVGITEVYMVDLHALTGEQLERIAAMLGARYGAKPEYLVEVFHRDGFPVIADGCKLNLCRPYFSFN